MNPLLLIVALAEAFMIWALVVPLRLREFNAIDTFHGWIAATTGVNRGLLRLLIRERREKAARYRPHVRMTILPQIKKSGRIEAGTRVLLPIFESACRITDAHSQPLRNAGHQADAGGTGEGLGRTRRRAESVPGEIATADNCEGTVRAFHG